MKSYDIAIVGAGLVGQAIAAALVGGKTSLPDLKVALIDPAEVVAPVMPEKVDEYDLRVSALTAKTQAFLNRLGAWQ